MSSRLHPDPVMKWGVLFQRHICLTRHGDTDKPADELVDAYSSGIQALIDKHAPLCIKVITLRPHAPGTRMFCVRLNMSVGRENGCGVEQG